MKKFEEGSFYLKGTNDIAVLLCHGLTGTPLEMRELGESINNQGYTVSCVEYRGHGANSKIFHDTNVFQWYEDLEIELKRLKSIPNIKGIFVMGLSMGGTFAVKLSTEHEVLGIVTFNAPLIGLPLKEIWEEMKSQYKDQDFVAKSRKSRRAYNDFVIRIGQLHILEKVTAPLLVVQGFKDQNRYKISSSMLMEYTSSTNKKRIDFAKSGHVITIDKEKLDVYKEVNKFLSGVTSK